MRIVRLTLMAIVIAFTSTSCSKQIDASPALTSETTASTLQAATLATATATAVATSVVQTSIVSNITSNIGGFFQALPNNYGATTTKYPLIISLHGTGELGNGTTDIYKVTNNSIPRLIKNKLFPASFTVNGQTFSFIVLAPQFKKWPTAADVNAIMNYALSHYRVDASRIYIVGLSMGGGVTWQDGFTYASKIAAIVPMAGACSLNDAGAKQIAAASLPVWAFHNNGDPTVNPNFTYSWVSRINKYLNPVKAKQTIFSSSSHDCWTKATDPNYKETINGVSMNIYQWLLHYKR